MNVRELLKALVNGDKNARIELYRMDEEVVDPLCEEFYSGVDEATGNVILEVISAIGGHDARRLLKYASIFGERESWRDTAERGLKENGFME
jgi:hypothetical protein